MTFAEINELELNTNSRQSEEESYQQDKEFFAENKTYIKQEKAQKRVDLNNSVVGQDK